MEGVLEKPPAIMGPEAIKALRIRSRVSFAAVKKIPAMLNIAGSDGRVRGSLSWSGAIRTHRWSGKLIQPQNFKRPTIKDTPEAYQAICDGWDHEMLSMVWGNSIETVASCIRHFIQEPDCQFLDADYANIEARIVPWLAGQENLLQAFRDGLDPYIMMAAKVFSKEVLEVTKDERFVGKQLVLGAGYQLGWEKFQAMCLKYGRTLEDELCQTAIKVYREENDQIVSLWRVLQRAAVDAIQNPGSKYKVRGKVTFGMASNLPFPALLARLPSGHHLVYPWPGLEQIWLFDKGKYPTKEQAERAYARWRFQREKDRKAGKLTEEQLAEEDPRVWSSQQISYKGPDPVTHQWGKRYTYGGSICENCWAGETEVLTPQGWKRIDTISNEMVFDGVEFVQHQGLKKTKEATTIPLDTLKVTPDHLILTPFAGWVKAKQVNIHAAYQKFKTCFRETCLEDEGYNRTRLWVSDSSESPAAGWVQTGEMALPVQVWGDPNADNFRANKRGQNLQPSVPIGEQRHPQNGYSPGLPCVEGDGCPLQAAYPPSVGQLWGEGDHGLQTVGEFCSVLEGYGPNLPGRSVLGTEKQCQGLQPAELQMGYISGASEKHQKQHKNMDPVGHHDRGGSSRQMWDQPDDNLLPVGTGHQRETAICQTGCKEPVYDLVNCGPRHQYVVRGGNKRPVIAHNCTQAIAGDFITYGALKAEEAGYGIVLLIHDQALAQFRPEAGQSAEGFQKALCTLPPWALDFPLVAECNAVKYYTKD